MLQKLNERIQGVIAWVVISLIVLTFALFGLDYYMQAQHASSDEVTVNGQSISKQDFELTYRRARQQRSTTQLTPGFERALHKEVLKEVITNAVSLQAATANGFQVNEAQAGAAILKIPDFQQDGHFSAQRYEQALSGAMYTPESFQKEVRQGMLLNQQRFAFIGSAFVLLDEMKHFIKLSRQTRNYHYLKIPASLFIDDSKIPLSAVESYYQNHLQEFLAPELVAINFISLSSKQIKDKITISEAEAKSYYEQNQANFRIPAQWQVAHILFAYPENASTEVQNQTKEKANEIYQKLLMNPDQFKQLVKTVSDDKLSAVDEGTLPWLIAGQTEFDKALIGLTKPGQLSPPVKTTHGYEIFKLLAYKPAALKPFTAAEADIKLQMLTERTQARYAQALEQLSDLSYQTPDTLTPVAEALNLPIEQTELFSRQGGTTALAKNKAIIQAAFSHDSLDLGNNSDPIQLDNETVVVLRVAKRVPATQKTLAETKGIIAHKLAFQEAQVQAKKMGLTLLASKDPNAPLPASIRNQQWHKVENIGRDSDQINSCINDFAFSLPQSNSQGGVSCDQGDYVIIRLGAINEGEMHSLDKEQQMSLVQQLGASYGLLDYEIYVNMLIKKSTVNTPKEN